MVYKAVGIFGNTPLFGIRRRIAVDRQAYSQGVPVNALAECIGR